MAGCGGCCWDPFPWSKGYNGSYHIWAGLFSSHMKYTKIALLTDIWSWTIEKMDQYRKLRVFYACLESYTRLGQFLDYKFSMWFWFILIGFPNHDSKFDYVLLLLPITALFVQRRNWYNAALYQYVVPITGPFLKLTSGSPYLPLATCCYFQASDWGEPQLTNLRQKWDRVGQPDYSTRRRCPIRKNPSCRIGKQFTFLSLKGK